MQGGLAISTLAVAVATGFILWGRTAAGKQTLTRLFGETTVRTPSKPSAAKPRNRKKSPPKSAAGATKTQTSRTTSSATSSKRTKSAPRAK